MKNSIVALLIVLISSTGLYSQNIFVANNNPGAATGTNVFTGSSALQDAIAAVSPGDIIYIVPSGINYGDATITQSLTLFGIGIRTDSQSTNNSVVGNIIIDASNIRISGVISTIEVQLGQNTPAGNTLSDILIENSRIRTIEMVSGSAELANLMVRNNVIQGSNGGGGHIDLKINSNSLITNNLFINNFTNGLEMVTACCGARFEYNIFADDGNEQPYDGVDNCIFTNNIFYGVNVQIQAAAQNNIWNYNLSFGGAGTVFNTTTNGNTGTGNLENRDPMFVNMPLTNTWSNSLDFTLQAGSPALSTDPLNTSSEDIGPSGGPTPFDFEGNILPLIQSITIPGVIPVGADLPVTIKAKGN